MELFYLLLIIIILGLYFLMRYNTNENFYPSLFLPNCIETAFGNTLCHRHSLRRYPIYKGARWSYPVFFSPYYY